MRNFIKETAAVLAAAVVAAAVNAPPALAAEAAERVGCDGTHSEYTLLSNTDLSSTNALGQGSYSLAESIELSAEIEITGDVTVCLNGYNITAGSSRVFKVKTGGSLTLCNCKTDGAITGKVSSSDDDGGAVYVMENGKFTMNGGTISSSTARQGGGVYVNKGKFTMTGGEISKNTASEQGGGVFVNDDSTFTMSGGTISENTVTGTADVDGGGGVYTAGKFTMNGSAEISGNNATNRYGGGVLVSGSKATFTLENNATISGNKANTYGGGVYVSSQGNVEMKGGTISGNDAISGGGGISTGGGNFIMSSGEISGNTSGRGGGAYLGSGTFMLNGGTLSNNEANKDGGGVYMGNGDFNMNGGTLSNNITQSHGGGVFLNKGTFSMSGGVISDNTASKYGNCIYMDNSNDGGGTMTLSGQVTITSNPKPDGSKSNVFLADGKTITIANGFDTTTQIGIHPNTSPADCRTFVPAATFADSAAASDISTHFKADREGQTIVYNDNEVKLLGGHSYDANAPWINDDDYHWHLCKVCEEAEAGKAAHNWNSGTITRHPTSAAAGVIRYDCIDCAAVKTAPIPYTPPSTTGGSRHPDYDDHNNKDTDNSVTSVPGNPPTGINLAIAPAALAMIAFATALNRKRR